MLSWSVRWRRLEVFFGDNQSLELVNHLGKQVERLGIFLHAICDHLCSRHHLLAEVVYVMTAVLNTAGHRLNSGPQLFHAALLSEQ